MDFKHFTAPANFSQLCGEPYAVRRSSGDELIRIEPTNVIGGIVLANHKGKAHLVSQIALEKLRGRVFKANLYLAMNERGDTFIYPVRADSPSACAVVEEAKTSWVRVQWLKGRKVYSVERSTKQLAEPTWPTDSFEDLVAAAFDDRIIDGPDHPLIAEIVAGGKVSDSAAAESAEDQPVATEIGGAAPGAAAPSGVAKPR